ncbi:MAG TPA: ester cyclase, partial [Saprospiraceae bacterium]|nr:ester cyclase [Saprospiraceae bacterium]
MKKSIVFLSLALALISTSCSQESTNINTKHYADIWDKIVNQGKIDLINESNFDQNITLISSPENVAGIEDFKAYYQNYLTGFSDIEFTVLDIFGQGDNIAKHWRFKGTHTGNFFGMPATGNKVDVEGVTIAKMKNGKIAQEQDFMDNMAFMQQLGIASDPNNIS